MLRCFPADNILIFSLSHLIRTPNQMLYYFKCNCQPYFNNGFSLLFNLNPGGNTFSNTEGVACTQGNKLKSLYFFSLDQT